jgi:hypothetical protein
MIIEKVCVDRVYINYLHHKHIKKYSLFNILMSELPLDISQILKNVPSLRKASVEDLFGCDIDDKNNQHNNGYNDDYIQKNQQHYGPRKRIKP